MDYVSQLLYVWYLVLNMLARNVSPRGYMCFSCLMYSLLGPCELLFLLCFIASCGECNIISLYFLYCSVNGSVCLMFACLTVFVNCLVKQFAMFLGVVCCWIDRVWSSKECVCCACDPSVHLDVLSMLLLLFTFQSGSSLVLLPRDS